MNGKKAIGIVSGLAALVALSLAGRSVLLAQKAQSAKSETAQSPEPAARTLVLGSGDDWFAVGGDSWLGVVIQDVTASAVRELKLPGEYGALVTRVEPDSPAARAGLEANDVILQFAGERVRSVAELRRLVRETPADRAVSIEISRGGQTRTLSVQMAKRENGLSRIMPPMPATAFPHVEIPRFGFMLQGPMRLGVEAEDLTPQLARYFGVAQGKGVLVNEVMAGSPAEKAGLKAGDCIVKAGPTEVGSVGELRRALAERGREASNEKRPITLTIVRDRHEQTLNVQLDESWHPSDQEVAELQKQMQALEKQLASERAQYRKAIQGAQERIGSERTEYQKAIEAARQQLESERSAYQKAMQEYLKPETQKMLRDLRRQVEDLKRISSEAVI